MKQVSIHSLASHPKVSVVFEIEWNWCVITQSSVPRAPVKASQADRAWASRNQTQSHCQASQRRAAAAVQVQVQLAQVKTRRSLWSNHLKPVEVGTQPAEDNDKEKMEPLIVCVVF